MRTSARLSDLCTAAEYLTVWGASAEQAPLQRATGHGQAVRHSLEREQ
jgi:hypothetical protein